MSVYFIQRIYAQQLAMEMYSASVVDNATEFCFLLKSKTKEHIQESDKCN